MISCLGNKASEIEMNEEYVNEERQNITKKKNLRKS